MGIHYTLKGEVCTICYLKHHKQVVVEVKMRNWKSFPIHWQFQKAMMANFDETTLWHQRFGHYNLNALRVLNQKNIISNLPLLDLNMPVC